MATSSMQMLPIDSPPASSVECACGCGEFAPKGKRFIQHHNARVWSHERYVAEVDIPGEEDLFRYLSKEQELMLAQLYDASHHKHACDASACEQCETDRAWALATAAWGLYAFINICEHLRIDWQKTQQWFLATAR